MKSVVVIAILSATAVTAALGQDRAAPDISGQTITGNELRDAGVTRLGDIFVLFDGVRFTTVDGFTTSPSFNGLAALQERVWRVEIDGQPVDDGILDAQTLNTLAVPVTSIDRIVVRDVPHVRRARFERGGVIEIWTRGGENDRFVRSSVSAGNETGDPGPYRYAEPDLRLENVDKQGPDVAVEGGFTRSGVATHLGLVMNQIIPSDPAVFRRNYRVFDASRTPVMRVVAPFVSLKSAIPTGDITVRASGAVFDDMFFSRNIAREVPAEHRRARISAVAQTRARSVDVQWNVDMARRIVRNFESATRIPFHWDEQNATASVAASGPFGEGTASAGAAVDYVGARSEQGLPDRETAVTQRIHAGVGGPIGSGSASLDVFGARDGSAYEAGGTLGASAPLWPAQRLHAFISVARTLPGTANPMVYWISRGLEPTPDGTTIVARSGAAPKIASADVQWSWNPDDTNSLRIAVVGRRFGGLHLSNRTIVPDGDGFVVESQSYDVAWGATIGVRLRGDLHAGRSRFTAAYSYQTVLAGDALFYEVFDTISRRQIRFTSLHDIADRFSISNSVYHYSSSRWADFEEVAREGLYSSVVPAFVRWDIAFYKGLAKDRLQVTVVFENLLNDRVGYHPIGATFDRAIRVQLALVL